MWRARAALAGGDLYGTMSHLDRALTEDPADWSAHAVFREALDEELPWLLTAVYRDLAANGNAEQRLLAQLALGESLSPAEGVEPILAALVRAQRHLNQGKAEATLSDLEGVADPRAIPLRVQALAELDRSGPLRREVREALRMHPEQPQLCAAALRREQDVLLNRGLRSQALSAAGELLATEEPTGMYRAHALYLSLGERELALAAAARLEALGEAQELAAHRPWSESMARDVGRLLAMQRSPKLPDGATPQEQARALAWAAREKTRKGQRASAEALWEQLLTMPQVPSPLYLEALLALESAGRSPQQLLLEAEQLRVGVAMDPLRQPDTLLQEAWLLSARSHRRLGQLEQALAAADLSAALGAGGAALVLQGEILEQLGQGSAAFFAYAEAASLGMEGLEMRLERVAPVPGNPGAVVRAIPKSSPEAQRSSVDEQKSFLAPGTVMGFEGSLSLEGQWTVVVFWASWCAPCHVELPEADAMAKRLEAQGVQVIAVSMDERREDALKYLSTAGLENMEQAWDLEFARALDVSALPTTV
ncbi:MAG: thiol-disulfide isomerase/thioredoxin, partial [Cognaticolwellia sp.]